MTVQDANTARLLVTCPDKPGIISAVSTFLFNHGANITDFDQHSSDARGGTFFLRLEFQTPELDCSREALRNNFASRVAEPYGMQWQISYASEKKRMAVMVSRHDHVIMDLLWRTSRGDLPATIPMVISNHEDLRGEVERFGIEYHHIPVSGDNKAEAEAKALAAAAGYGDGMKLAINLSSAAATVTTAEVVAEQLKTILGLEFTLNVMDRASFGPRMRNGEDNISIASSSPLIPDPSDFLNQHYLTNTLKNPENWTHPRLNELIVEQAKERDPAKRLDLFREAVEILRQGEGHWVPVTWGYSGGLMDYRLQGFKIPELDQTVKHWEATWWDPDAVKPPCASGALEGLSC